MADLVYLGVRYYILVLCALVAVVGTMQWRRWFSFKAENQLAWMAIVALNLSSFVGTAESIIQDIPGGIRTFVLAAAMTWLLGAVLYHPFIERFNRTSL